MHIRDAQLADLPRIIDIYNAAIPQRLATGDLEPVSLVSRLEWFDRHQADTRPLWVMESDRCIIGWLGFQDFYGRPAYQATAELSIYIDSDYHRRGVGRILLNQAIEKSPSLGLKALVAFIFAHNQPSLKLFRGFGFETWGYMPRVAKMDDLERDLVILGLHLP